MRSLILLATVALLSACASQAPAPAPTKTDAAPAAKKAAQCWNGDMSAFQDVGTKATLANVAVECKPTADGKAAQWMGVNAKH
jgi:outer membrane biogenesis lipoprotein LolB